MTYHKKILWVRCIDGIEELDDWIGDVKPKLDLSWEIL